MADEKIVGRDDLGYIYTAIRSSFDSEILRSKLKDSRSVLAPSARYPFPPSAVGND